LPNVANLHRAVMTPASADQGNQLTPYSAIDSQRPEDLWSWLDETSKKLGIDFIAIPHNANIAVIARSIVFLARELLRQRRDTLTWRYPIAVASSFGLLHGLGFAAVLGGIGLPQPQLVAALAFFNLGVELGQLLFILAAVFLYKLALWTWEWIGFRNLLSIEKTQMLLVYSVGGLSTLWVLERISRFI
jgi:hypothetical protein